VKIEEKEGEPKWRK